MQDIVTQLPYRALPSLEEAKQVARVSRSQIREFGNIICKHGLHETFGICLFIGTLMLMTPNDWCTATINT
jgi:hypothetical protein